MSDPSPLLVNTVDRVLLSLRQSGQIEMESGRHDEVVRFCSEYLASAGFGAQLVDTLSKAMVECEFVEELYATDEELKSLITEVMQI